MTIDDLAARLELLGLSYTPGSIGHWESGRRRMPLHDPAFVTALAAALRLDVATVLRLSGYALPQQHSDLTERLAAIADRLPDDKRRQLLDIAETFIRQ